MIAAITGMAHVGDVDEKDWRLDQLEFAKRADRGGFTRLWIVGDSYIKIMYRKNAQPARTIESREAHKHEGQLWERVLESGER